MTTKQKRNELKDIIVKQVLNGKSIYSIAKQFELNKYTVSRWVRRFQETGSAQRICRPNIAYKVTEDHVKFAKTYIQNHGKRILLSRDTGFSVVRTVQGCGTVM